MSRPFRPDWASRDDAVNKPDKTDKEVKTMNDETSAERKTETAEKKVTLIHWDRVDWVTPVSADVPPRPPAPRSV